MFCLNCSELNNDLCQRANKQKDQLISFEVSQNRRMNREYECLFRFYYIYLILENILMYLPFYTVLSVVMWKWRIK